MRLKILAFSLIGILQSCHSQNREAVNAQNIQSALSKTVQEEIFSKVKYFPDGTQLSIALVDADRTTFYGIERVNDSIITVVNKNAIFEIGSISKVFTSTLLADAVVREELNLTDTIPLQLNDDIKITYKQLSNHTSGLPRLPKNLFLLSSFRSDNPYKDYNTSLLEDYMQNAVELDQEPETKSSYSNLGAGLLGHILAKNNSTSYEELVKDRIFSKYDMGISTTQKNEVKESLIPGRNANGEITSNWDLASLQGAGGILSSVEDLAKFTRAHFNQEDEVLVLSRKRTFSVREDLDIALGWFIIKQKEGEHIYFHNGGTGGYSSSLAMDLENKKAIIILSNLSAFHKMNKNIDALSLELLKLQKQ